MPDEANVTEIYIRLVMIILGVCSTGLHSSHGARRVHQSTKASHAGKKGYDWSCM
jgi:hypothetical protein